MYTSSAANIIIIKPAPKLDIIAMYMLSKYFLDVSVALTMHANKNICLSNYLKGK